MRVVCVAGARPNFVKVKPVMDALEEGGAEVLLVHTGQHYDPVMSDIFFEDLGLRRPDYFLGAGSGSHATQTCRVMTAFEPLIGQLAADVVVVVGDVNSTLACALVTAKSGVLLAHVEAGLRSGDWSMPEEVNRIVTDRVSDYLFAPSPDTVANLQAEGYRDGQIHLVGNVMVDTLLTNLGRATSRDIVSQLGLEPGQYGLVTLHRPANVDNPSVLGSLLPALAEIADLCPLVLPAHPRAAGRLRGAGLPSGVRIIPPAGYLDFVALEASARLVLTDSGGVQEETTVLGVPCLTLRDNTERPITLTEGTNRLVGRDPARIVAAVREVLACPPPRRAPALWDGRASQRIAAALFGGIGDGERLRRPASQPILARHSSPRPQPGTADRAVHVAGRRAAPSRLLVLLRQASRMPAGTAACAARDTTMATAESRTSCTLRIWPHYDLYYTLRNRNTARCNSCAPRGTSGGSRGASEACGTRGAGGAGTCLLTTHAPSAPHHCRGTRPVRCGVMSRGDRSAWRGEGR